MDTCAHKHAYCLIYTKHYSHANSFGYGVAGAYAYHYKNALAYLYATPNRYAAIAQIVLQVTVDVIAQFNRLTNDGGHDSADNYYNHHHWHCHGGNPNICDNF